MKAYMTELGTRLCWSELDRNSLELGGCEWGPPEAGPGDAHTEAKL